MSDTHTMTSTACNTATAVTLIVFNRMDLRLMGLITAVSAAAATVGLTA